MRGIPHLTEIAIEAKRKSEWETLTQAQGSIEMLSAQRVPERTARSLFCAKVVGESRISRMRR